MKKTIKYDTYIKILYPILFLTAVSCFPRQDVNSDKIHFTTRGLILDVNDLSTVDWPLKAKRAGLTTLATHITPSQVTEFIESARGQQFLKECREHGIAVEHELHAIHDLLPRDLFYVDSTMFRMDTAGRRRADYNLCVHSKAALDTVGRNAVKYARILRPTTARYYFWIDDGMPMCSCSKCRSYSDSEQALILENELVKVLRREVDPDATLAHLAYGNTLEAPLKVKPAVGVFLEYAPFHRTWARSLLDTAAIGREGGKGISHAQYLKKLDDNLKVFPVETAQVLEYWLDVSLFSDWKKPAAALPWNLKVFTEDIDVYAKRGITKITSFGVYMDADYFKKYPSIKFLNQYGQGLKEYQLR